MSRILLAVSISMFALVASLTAAEDENAKSESAAEAAQAGPDFAVQGEYAGEVETDDGKRMFGVQVIARGEGMFRAVGYPGGLPGDGWDGEDRIMADGATRNGVTKFVAEQGTAVVEDGSLVLTSNDGRNLGTLTKVERKSPTLGKKPPAGAIVLFDGTSADAFEGARVTEDGLLMQGATSKQTFGDCMIHLEFRTPFMPAATGQARGNSGCYLQGRYEVQILDSFGLTGENNECGGIYTVSPPSVNMCFPPLSWQTYDIAFTAARYDEEGNKVSNARLSAHHNGVLIQSNVEIPYATRAAPLKEGPEPGPLYLQDHGNPVRFRNIWVVEAKPKE